jgi:predicted DNA-binding WGR domain protein
LRLVKQIKLYFQEGNSDKVYEIDLCESGDGYIVNFRYGRRGASLKEGTKTIFPVALPEAEKVFAALEQEKRKKGYTAAGEAPLVISAMPRTTSSGIDKRRKAILKILKVAAAGEEPETWRLSRVIWRAGDLKLKEAIPSIHKLTDTSDSFTLYSIVWAIGRCGSASDVPLLKTLQAKPVLPQHIKQLITEVLLKHTEGSEKEQLLNQILGGLPLPIQKNVQEKNYKLLTKQLREYLFELKTTSNEYLVNLYQLSRQDQSLHKVLLTILEEVPLAVNFFKHIRHIFKTSEMLEDYATYAVIAKNIEKRPGNFSSFYYEQGQRQNSAFTNTTKGYLTSRVLRFLRNYGEMGEPAYTELASELLLAFRDDQDATKPYQTADVSYHYNSTTRTHIREEKITHFDSYAPFQAFNSILYKNSARYLPGKQAWKCIAPFVPGNPTPTSREEAYPHLWNKAPEEIIALLANSKANRVHEFALKVFTANPTFEAQVEMQHVVQFVRAPFLLTQQLGLTLARKKFDRLDPNKELLIAMLESSLAEAREQAFSWIDNERKLLLSDAEFVVRILLVTRKETHEWIRSFLASISMAPAQSEVIAAKLITHLISMEIETEEDRLLLRQLSDTLVNVFSSTLRNIHLQVIRDMFANPSEEIHALAGKILLKHETKAEDLPDDFLALLLQSGNPYTRGIGISLLGQFSDAALLAKKEVLISFCISPLEDVRSAVRPIIFRLVQSTPDFGITLIDLFVPAFLMKESYEGLHEDLLSLLANELGGSLSAISKERSLRLLHSKFKSAQQLGCILLKKNIKEEELTVAELVKMGNNPTQEVRLYAWEAFKRNKEKVRAEKEEALKLTDSSWDDTRLFAFDFFREQFSEYDWNTELLVMLCDSVREDVQAFGREMITRFFVADQGTDYLLKLSQHPNTKVQLFTTTYLEQHATDNYEVLQSLKPYFITLLSQVNKGRVAKIRVMEFLRKEALKNETNANFVLEILKRVSASVAIAEKAQCIALMRDIQSHFAALQSLLIVKPYSDYIKA